MEYLISFFEGIITFISPCLLPMLPIYLLYFAGEPEGVEDGQTGYTVRLKRTVSNSMGFVLGFTIVFVVMGAFAAGIGGLLRQYQTAVNIITGLIVIVLGLNFTGVLKLGFLNRTHKLKSSVKPLRFFSSVLFGMVFSIGWTPCVGAFLGSALLLASQQGSVAKGVLMLIVYSLGLGIPFVLSAVLINRLKGTFSFIKRHYRIINIVCGLLLIVVGILMMTGMMNALLALFTL